MVGVRFQMQPNWHIYWRNPGDSGVPTTIAWDLPEGWTAGPISWPVPKAFESQGFVSFGYSGEIVLLTKLTPPQRLNSGEVVIRGRASWLACEETCVPEGDTFSVTVRSAPNALPDEKWSEVLRQAWAALPRRHAAARVATLPDGYRVSIDVTLPDTGISARFFPYSGEVTDHGAPQPLTEHARGFTLDLKRSEFASRPPERLQGIVVFTGPSSLPAIEIDLPISSTTGGTQ